MELFPVQDKEESSALVDACACSTAEIGIRLLPWPQTLQCRVAGAWTGCSAAFSSTSFQFHPLLILQSFDWLANFYLELLQAIIFIKALFINPTDAHNYKITGMLKQLKFPQLLRHVSVHSGTIIREPLRA